MRSSVVYTFLALLLVIAVFVPNVAAITKKQITCKDYHSKCGQNTQLCRHKTYRLMMVHLCAISCSHCSEHIALKAACQDKLTTCKESLCHKPNYKKMMYEMCRETCKRC